MPEPLMDQFVQFLQERANLSEEQAQQAAGAAVDFGKQHLPRILETLQGGQGGVQLPGGLGGMLGGLFGGQQK
jgi:hypothetical protein